jgi:hypothetical protein
LKWLLAALALCGCVSSQERMHMASLEARIRLLEGQQARSRTAELMLAEQVGRLKERLEVVRSELSAHRGDSPPAPAGAHPDGRSEGQPGAAREGSPPSPEQLTRLWRRTGELLDHLHGQGAPSELRGLIDDYLEINIHGGLINEALRRRYFATLQRIHGQAMAIEARRKP